MAIQLRAPSRLRNLSSSIWYNSSWLTLDVDRIDFTVNNDVKVYEQVDEETQLNQYYGAKIQVFVTGYLTPDSDFTGANLTTKAKNLVLAGRQWYYGLRAQDDIFPEFKWDSKTYQFLFQKVMIIDKAEIGDEVIDYQIGILLKPGA